MEPSQGQSNYAIGKEIKEFFDQCESEFIDNNTNKLYLASESQLERISGLLQRINIVGGSGNKKYVLPPNQTGKDKFGIIMTPGNIQVLETSLHVPPVALSDNQKENLSSFLSHVETLAPDANRALTCSVGNAEYKIWWNASAKAVNIQKKENFLSPDHVLKHENKLGIKELNDNFFLFINNEPTGEFPQGQMELVQALMPKVEELKSEHSAMLDLENKFNPQSLNLMLNFLKGPLGVDYRYNATAGKSESKKLLPFGNDIVVWMRSEESQVMTRGQSSSATETKYYINFQKKDAYNRSLASDKLGIMLNGDGTIGSVRVDGQPADVGQVFSADAPWNRRLTDGINQFLETHALNKSIANVNIALHPLLLSQRPEAALQHLCSTGSFKINQGVNFLDDELQRGPGIDAGGLTKQLMGDLGRYLFDGSKSRTVKMASGIPALSKPDAAGEKEILKNFGKMLAVCYQNEGFVVGRIFPDKYFTLVKALLGVNPPISDDLVIQLSKDEITSDDNMRWMWDVYNNPRPLTSDEKEMVELIGICEENEIPQDAPGVKNLIKNYLLTDYPGNLRNKVLAAHAIGEGIKSGVTQQQMQVFKNLPIDALSLKLQGVQFSREDIARRVVCQAWEPAVRQKAEWLKELILDHSTPESWIKSLLITITGLPVVTASTTIKIKSTPGDFCSAHTCFNTIDVPFNHVNNGTHPSKIVPNVNNLTDSNPLKFATYKQYFKDNLQITMNETGFDMG